MKTRVVNEKIIKTQPQYFTEGHLVWMYDVVKAFYREEKFSSSCKGSFKLINKVSKKDMKDFTSLSFVRQQHLRAPLDLDVWPM